MACPKCNGEMEPGFIPDVGYGNVSVSRWVDGDPQTSWTGVVKTRGKRNLEISADRCTQCGFLELYAN